MTKIININEYKRRNEPPERYEKVFIPVFDPSEVHSGEYPWVIVKEQTEDHLTGTLHNHPVLIELHGFRFGDEIEARKVNGRWQVVSHPAGSRIRKD